MSDIAERDLPRARWIVSLGVLVIIAVWVVRAVDRIDDVLNGPDTHAATIAERSELTRLGSLVFGAGPGEIYVARGDGGRSRLVASGRKPAWAPDGQRLAFETGAEIWVARADGSNPRRIVDGENPAWAISSPSWSPVRR